ncbi:MAG: hypothetical protein AAF410_05415, partial [Pseudomonadota bacterium]
MQYKKNNKIKNIISHPDNIASEYDIEIVKSARAFSLFAFAFLLFFAAKVLLSGLVNYAIILFFFALTSITTYWFIGRKSNSVSHKYLMVIMMGALSLVLLYHGGEDGSAPLWYLVFPPLAIFLLGIIRGLIAIIALLSFS